MTAEDQCYDPSFVVTMTAVYCYAFHYCEALMIDLPSDDMLSPAEQLPITFFNAVVLAARRDDGRIYLNIRDLCQAAMIDPSSQMRRIRSPIPCANHRRATGARLPRLRASSYLAAND